MKLIVGLGNPGTEYENTRHNIGFMCVDYFMMQNKLSFDKKGLSSEYYKGKDFIIAKPQTFMNLSGIAVSKIASFYKIDPSDIIVIHDDLDLPVGTFKIREKGSSGGHNGLKSIIQELGTENFKRVRIGIDNGLNTISHVLGKFKDEEMEKLENIIKEASSIIEDSLTMTFNKVMTLHNKRK